MSVSQSLDQLINNLREDANYYYFYLPSIVANEGLNNRKIILVNGSPKTGTTWMYKMITSIPGYRGIGHFHGDIQRYDIVSPGNVIHGHDPYDLELGAKLIEKNLKTIILIRDPRDQLISRVFHIMRDSSHQWHHKLQSLSLNEAIMACIEGREELSSTRNMIEHTLGWLQGSSVNKIYVRYEDLLGETGKQYMRVLSFLEIRLNHQLIDAIVLRNRFERLSIGRKFWLPARKAGETDPQSHFRKGINGDWQNFLNPEHIMRFKELAGDLLIDLGYESDYDWGLI